MVNCALVARASPLSGVQSVRTHKGHKASRGRWYDSGSSRVVHRVIL